MIEPEVQECINNLLDRYNLIDPDLFKNKGSIFYDDSYFTTTFRCEVNPEDTIDLEVDEEKNIGIAMTQNGIRNNVVLTQEDLMRFIEMLIKSMACHKIILDNKEG